jgi:alkylation response protein AidB-like acyl-CoA dehydrogenase
MRFHFDEEQRQLKESARRFLSKHSDSLALRRFLDTQERIDGRLWRRITEELGWTALTVNPQFDGVGLGHVALAALMEEMGRRLVCVPYFSAVSLGIAAVSTLGSPEQKHRVLPGCASGKEMATLAWQAPDGQPDELGVTAQKTGDGYELSGQIRYILDGDLADHIVVLARLGAVTTGFLLGRDTPGLDMCSTQALDPTRQLASLDLQSVKVSWDARMPGDQDSINRVFDGARVAISAEMVGGAEQCLDMAVEYAKQRQQFGRAIGSFQAIKHMCADMLLAVESARSAVYFAAWVADNEPTELPEAAAIAKAYASDAYCQCAAANIQIHGGIGFTWEHDAHLYFKRAQASSMFLGDGAWHRERIADWVL